MILVWVSMIFDHLSAKVKPERQRTEERERAGAKEKEKDENININYEMVSCHGRVCGNVDVNFIVPINKAKLIDGVHNLCNEYAMNVALINGNFEKSMGIIPIMFSFKPMVVNLFCSHYYKKGSITEFDELDSLPGVVRDMRVLIEECDKANIAHVRDIQLIDGKCMLVVNADKHFAQKDKHVLTTKGKYNYLHGCASLIERAHIDGLFAFCSGHGLRNAHQDSQSHLMQIIDILDIFATHPVNKSLRKDIILFMDCCDGVNTPIQYRNVNKHDSRPETNLIYHPMAIKICKNDNKNISKNKNKNGNKNDSAQRKNDNDNDNEIDLRDLEKDCELIIDFANKNETKIDFDDNDDLDTCNLNLTNCTLQDLIPILKESFDKLTFKDLNKWIVNCRNALTDDAIVAKRKEMKCSINKLEDYVKYIKREIYLDVLRDNIISKRKTVILAILHLENGGKWKAMMEKKKEQEQEQEKEKKEEKKNEESDIAARCRPGRMQIEAEDYSPIVIKANKPGAISRGGHLTRYMAKNFENYNTATGIIFPQDINDISGRIQQETKQVPMTTRKHGDNRVFISCDAIIKYHYKPMIDRIFNEENLKFSIGDEKREHFKLTDPVGKKVYDKESNLKFIHANKENMEYYKQFEKYMRFEFLNEFTQLYGGGKDLFRNLAKNLDYKKMNNEINLPFLLPLQRVPYFLDKTLKKNMQTKSDRIERELGRRPFHISAQADSANTIIEMLSFMEEHSSAGYSETLKSCLKICPRRSDYFNELVRNENEFIFDTPTERGSMQYVFLPYAVSRESWRKGSCIAVMEGARYDYSEKREKEIFDLYKKYDGKQIEIDGDVDLRLNIETFVSHRCVSIRAGLALKKYHYKVTGGDIQKIGIKRADTNKGVREMRIWASPRIAMCTKRIIARNIGERKRLFGKSIFNAVNGALCSLILPACLFGGDGNKGNVSFKSAILDQVEYIGVFAEKDIETNEELMVDNSVLNYKTEEFKRMLYNYEQPIEIKKLKRLFWRSRPAHHFSLDRIDWVTDERYFNEQVFVPVAKDDDVEDNDGDENNN